MGIFGNLKSEGLEQAKDTLGGGGAVESDAYTAEIKLAYAVKSQGGAHGVAFQFDLGNGQQFRPTIYITNKQGENFYLNRQDSSKKVPLPGFTTVNNICIVTTDKELADQATEEKIVKVYDFEKREEVNKSVDVLVELLGQKVDLGIIKVLQNKNKKNDSTGQYEATAEETTVNEIDAVFETNSKLTVFEAQQGQPEADFYGKWVEKNKGKTKDKREYKDGQTGQAGRPAKANAGPPAQGEKPRQSLFGNKA